MSYKNDKNNKWSRSDKIILAQFLWLPIAYVLAHVQTVKTQLSELAKLLDIRTEILIILIVAILFVILTFIILLKVIKKNKTKNQITEADKISLEYRNKIFDTFNEIITEIEISILPAGDIILKHFAETNEFERIIINNSSEKFSSEFSKIYLKYKKPRNESVWPKIWVYPYNLDQKEFVKHPEYHIDGVNNGEEFAKYNIQKIFDFLK